MGLHDSENGYEGMVILGAFAGLRFGEVAALRHDSLELETSSPRVRVTQALNREGEVGPPKTNGSVRTVGVPAFLAPLLVKVRDRRGSQDANPLVFQSPRGGPIAYTRWRSRVWNRAVSVLEWEAPPGFHDLRHTYAATLIDEGVHPKKIQQLLGHTTIRTTMDVYGHLMDGEDEGAGLALSGNDVAHTWHAARVWSGYEESRRYSDLRLSRWALEDLNL